MCSTDELELAVPLTLIFPSAFSGFESLLRMYRPTDQFHTRFRGTDGYDEPSESHSDRLTEGS